MGGLDNVHPLLVQRFLSLQRDASAAGFSIGVTSGWRSTEEQARLRRTNGCPDIWTSPASSCRVPTAIPGRSNHNSGLAIDISGSAAAKAWVAQNAARYGLHLPVEGEDWHLEMIEDEASRNVAGAFPNTIGFDLVWADQAQSPEDLADQRIRGLMDAFAGAMNDASIEAPPAENEMLETPAESDLLATPGIEAAETPQTSTGAITDSQLADVPTELRDQTLTMGGEGAGPMAAGSTWQGGMPPPGYVPPGRGVQRWRDVALAALRYTGQNESYIDLLLRRMAQESGGNPTIVNDWDINWQRGDPSVGLMQNIRSAFPERAGELANRGITDGFANIVASIRYTLQRYGSLNAWGRPGGY